MIIQSECFFLNHSFNAVGSNFARQARAIWKLVTMLRSCLVPMLLSPWFSSIWSEYKDRKDRVPAKGIILECDLKPAIGLNVTVSTKSQVYHKTSDQQGTFTLHLKDIGEVIDTVETPGRNVFSGLAILGNGTNWTLGNCPDATSAWEQVAICPTTVLMGQDVQTRFVDNPTDPRVICPCGKLVEASLVFQSASSWIVCNSLCPKQACFHLASLSTIAQAIADDCLMKNVQKNFHVDRAASMEAALLQILQENCVEKLTEAYNTFTEDLGLVPSNFQRLIEEHDPWQGRGNGKTLIVDTSGSMSGINRHLQRKLGQEWPNVDRKGAGDSSFTQSGSMGRSLLTTLESQSLPDYAMVIVVSDFQDSVEGSFCETLGKLAERKHAVIVLESVERYPQACLHEVAKKTGGHSSVGRIARK